MCASTFRIVLVRHDSVRCVLSRVWRMDGERGIEEKASYVLQTLGRPQVSITAALNYRIILGKTNTAWRLLFFKKKKNLIYSNPNHVLLQDRISIPKCISAQNLFFPFFWEHVAFFIMALNGRYLKTAHFKTAILLIFTVRQRREPTPEGIQAALAFTELRAGHVRQAPTDSGGLFPCHSHTRSDTRLKSLVLDWC